MKRFANPVSLVLILKSPHTDNLKEHSNLVGKDNTLSLSCPDYLPPKLIINETFSELNSEFAFAELQLHFNQALFSSKHI